MSSLATAQGVVPRVAGLEDNTEYMTLLKDEKELHISRDSISSELNKLRASYQLTQSGDASIAEQILVLEGRIFEMRNQIGEFESKIASIEQEYIINNLNTTQTNAPTVSASSQATGDYAHLSSTSTNLIYNQRLAQQLNAEDYSLLKEANERENAVANYIRIFLSNYNAIGNIADQYKKTDDLMEGDSLYRKYIMLNSLNIKIADSVETIWHNIYDQKSYVYSYVFDKLNRSDILSQFEQKVNQTREKQAQMQGEYCSDVLAIYPTERRLIMDYELQICDLLELKEARDSVSRRQSSIDTENLLLPKIIVEQRDFIDYDHILIGSNPYTAANPIPECIVYPRGTIYRIIVGTFTYKQQPSIFRGASPISVYLTEDKRYSYFLGGYAELTQAQEAVVMLKKTGFRKPEIVVWEDGLMRKLSDDEMNSKLESSPDGRIYRLEITLADNDLPETIKSLIKEEDSSLEISRIPTDSGGFTFIIGTFVSEGKARDVSEKITLIQNDIRPEIKTLE